jgi:arylsulfatase A-like enzyme
LVPTVTVASPIVGPAAVDVEAFNFSPASLELHVDNPLSPAIATDATAPYSLPFNTLGMTTGVHRLWVLGSDDHYVVGEQVQIQVGAPNIVTILLDDLDAAVSPYWDALPQTRALLADQGLVFENSFATNPLCCPARATILTGKYPHNTGVWTNSGPLGGYPAFAPNESSTIAVALQQAGYRTQLAGKYFNGYDRDALHIPPGWTDWFALTSGYDDGYSYAANDNGTIRSFGSDTTDYVTDVLRDRALAFVDQGETNDDQPFFMYLAPTAPHFSIGPPSRYADNPFADDPLPSRPNLNEADVSDKPTWLRAVPLWSFPDAFRARGDYQRRLGSLLAVDDMVSALVDRLATDGELARTVIAFASDNGYLLGAHRLDGKIAPYEESIRVPLVIAGPGLRHGVDSSLVAHIDIAPTILDLAGRAVPATMDGRSLVPLLHATVAAWRPDFLVEFRGATLTLADTEADIAAGRHVIPAYRAIRTAQWEYVELYTSDPHEYELYDLTADPYELDNLLATPEGVEQYEAVVAPLRTRLDALAACAGTSCN